MSASNTSQARWFVYVVAAVVICFSASVIGQDEPTREFGLFPHSAPGGILVLIGGNALHPNTAALNDGWIGYYVYRRVAGAGAYERLTAEPLSRVSTLEEFENFAGGSVTGLEVLTGHSDTKELWRSIEQNDPSILVLSMMSKRFREALGLLYRDTEVQEGQTYEYYATRVAADGAESEPSEALTATYGMPPLPLVQPTDLKAVVHEENIVLSWRVADNDSATWAYSVYRAADPNGAFLRLNRAPLAAMPDSTGDMKAIQSFVDTTARVGRTWYYTVISMDYGGNESARDSIVEVYFEDRMAPPVPQTVAATPHRLGIAVSWDVGTADDLSGFNVFRSTDPDSNFVKINPVLLPRDTGWFVDRAVDLSTRQFYRVSAVDLAGNESPMSARTPSLFQNRTRPLPPQEVTVETRGDSIILHWTANEESDVRGYYVFRADIVDGDLSQVSELIPADTTLFMDTSAYLSERGHYWYLVSAINYSGLSSDYSRPVVASPIEGVSPDAPLSFYGYQDGRKVRLFWIPPEDVMIAGYRVYRVDAGTNDNWELLTPTAVAAGFGEYVDTAVSLGRAYAYHLRSLGTNGVEGDRSRRIEVTMFRPAPLAPGQVRIARTDNGYRLVWDKSLQPDLTGYHVYLRTDGKEAQRVTSEALALDMTEFELPTPTMGLRQFYSVTCVNLDGRESERSPEAELSVR